MRLFDFFDSEEKAETIRKHNMSNGTNSANGSAGSLRNPMYRNICCSGAYIASTARNYRRADERAQRKAAKALQRENKSVSKFHKGFA